MEYSFAAAAAQRLEFKLFAAGSARAELPLY
jgi:hypothetical protein